MDFVQLINKMLGEKVICDTKHLFLKNFAENLTANYHYKCKKCDELGYSCDVLDKNSNCLICKECGHDNTKERNRKLSFVSFKVEENVKKLLNKHRDELLFTDNQEQFPIRDCLDGNLSKKWFFKYGKFYSFTLNTDGVQRFRSSKNSLWPVFIILNNLPTHVRYKPENMITVGLFYGRDLEIDFLLEPLLNEVNQINQNGGLDALSGQFKLICLCTALDSAAKPKLENHKNYNGFYGCPYCFNKGVSIGRSMKFLNE